MIGSVEVSIGRPVLTDRLMKCLVLLTKFDI